MSQASSRIARRLLTALAEVTPEQQAAAQEVLTEEIDLLETEGYKARELEEVKTLRIHNEILEQNALHRKEYAKKIFRLTCCWVGLIFVILLLQGFGNYRALCFNLSDSVLITMITTTTINVFGFFLLVVKYLFNTPSSIKKKIR